MLENQKYLKVKLVDGEKVTIVADDQEIELKKEFLPADVKVDDKLFVSSEKNFSSQKSAKELLNEILGMG